MATFCRIHVLSILESDIKEGFRVTILNKSFGVKVSDLIFWIQIDNFLFGLDVLEHFIGEGLLELIYYWLVMFLSIFNSAIVAMFGIEVSFYGLGWVIVDINLIFG